MTKNLTLEALLEVLDTYPKDFEVGIPLSSGDVGRYDDVDITLIFSTGGKVFLVPEYELKVDEDLAIPNKFIPKILWYLRRGWSRLLYS